MCSASGCVNHRKAAFSVAIYGIDQRSKQTERERERERERESERERERESHSVRQTDRQHFNHCDLLLRLSNRKDANLVFPELE